MCEEVETAIKVVLVGNGAVGKSSLIQRYCKGIFTREYKKTIGVDFLERQIEVDGEDVRLMLWDTAGQEEFDAITKTYYRGAHVAVVSFSLTDRESYLAAEQWVNRVEEECDKIPMVLVLNKMDLIQEALVSVDEAEALAHRLQLKLFLVSVKDGTGVDEIFHELTHAYLQSVELEEREVSPVISTAASPVSGGSEKKSKRKRRQADESILSLPSGKQQAKAKKVLNFKCSVL